MHLNINCKLEMSSGDYPFNLDILYRVYQQLVRMLADSVCLIYLVPLLILAHRLHS